MSRLRDIRRRAGFTQERLASALGTPRSTVQKLETGKIKLHSEWARRISKVLPCQPGDLYGVSHIQVVGYVGAGEVIFFFDDHAQGGGLDEVVAPPNFNGIAVRVRGDSMAPRYFDGDILYYEREIEHELSECVGRDCIVRLQDGSTLVKRVEMGRGRGEVILRSHNPATAARVVANIEWLAPIRWVQPG